MDNISKIKFYIPYLYFFIVHARTSSRMISWMLIYTVPVFIYVSLFSEDTIYKTFLVFTILTTVIYNFYEIGYINNDTETIKNEKCPTMRLSSFELIYYEENKLFIYLFRLLLGITLIICTYYLTKEIDYNINLLLFSLLMFLMLLTYKIYNSVRSKLNIIVSLILSTFRYSSITLSIICVDYTVTLLLIIFIFPFVNLINWLAKPKYKIEFAIKYFKNIELIRVLYYFILSIVLGVLYKVFDDDIILIFMYVSIYYLSLRIGYYILMKNNNKINKSVNYARKTKYYGDSNDKK
ncbi:hypothetical protein [Aliarcobacter cibarius]|uniref:hypothetical protein n=1 Tax=Aliarcobacter cibarius TaxID=255507 RepID=UPI0010FF5406|nr:hypothetical protein [Aliarcobacter cibarius]TLT05308.1 hypothetical protein FE248_01040 [Aliarcobacter cibarius]